MDTLDKEDGIEIEKSQIDIFKEKNKTAKFIVLGNMAEDGIEYKIGDAWKPSKDSGRTKEFITANLIKKVR